MSGPDVTGGLSKVAWGPGMGLSSRSGGLESHQGEGSGKKPKGEASIVPQKASIKSRVYCRGKVKLFRASAWGERGGGQEKVVPCCASTEWLARSKHIWGYFARMVDRSSRSPDRQGSLCLSEPSRLRRRDVRKAAFDPAWSANDFVGTGYGTGDDHVSMGNKCRPLPGQGRWLA